MSMSLKKQNPVALFLRKGIRLATGSSAKGFPLRPEHLFASVQKLQRCPGRLPGFERRRLATIFTVARPRGILTRFPCSSRSTRDTRTHLKELGTFCSYESGASYHELEGKSKPFPKVDL
jgi:hypothetical protein